MAEAIGLRNGVREAYTLGYTKISRGKGNNVVVIQALRGEIYSLL